MIKDRKKRLAYLKTYRETHKEQIRLGRLDWAHRNREKDNSYKKKWRKNNKNQELVYQKNRRGYDIHYKLVNNLRHRIYLALKGKTKSQNTMKILGCAMEDLKRHLESKFQNGMSWDNHGINGWHIDHIRPCASFDLSQPEEQAQCFHFSNLQPLWATTDIARQNGDMESIGNLNKGDKI